MPMLFSPLRKRMPPKRPADHSRRPWLYHKGCHQMMKKNDFPGIRVVLFAFGDDFPHSIHLPHHYGKNCVAYTGTHDNNTIIGFLKDATCIEKKIWRNI
jgi:4-alpha-glucanotransferase